MITNSNLYESARMLEAVFEAVRTELHGGNEVLIRGFGCFYNQVYESRKSEHPRTRELISVPSRSFVRFRPSLHLRQDVEG